MTSVNDNRTFSIIYSFDHRVPFNSEYESNCKWISVFDEDEFTEDEIRETFESYLYASNSVAKKYEKSSVSTIATCLAVRLSHDEMTRFMDEPGYISAWHMTFGTGEPGIVSPKVEKREIEDEPMLRSLLKPKVDNAKPKVDNAPPPWTIKVHHLYNIETQWADSAAQNGVITIVSQYIDSLGYFKYGVSVCRPGDNFNKKIGIKVASTRMDSISVHGSPEELCGWFRYDREKRYFDIRQMIFVDMLCNMTNALPAWVIETIKYEVDMSKYNTFME